MKILGLDTSTLRGSAAVADSDRLIMDVSWDLPPKSHTEHLVPIIDHMLRVVGWRYEDLDGLVVTHGPGSFTGLRIGISVAKGIALAHELPLVGVSSLEALAYGLRDVTGLVVPMFDAKKKQIYAAAFETGTRTRDDCVIDPTAFLESLRGDPVWLLGDGAVAYRDLCEQILGKRARFVPELTRGGHVIAVGRHELASASSDDVQDVSAQYLRAPEAVTS